MDHPVSWTERAVLVHHVAAASRRVSGQGTLRQMVNRLAAMPIAEWRGYTISLPDRRSMPFDYGPDDFSNLIEALDT